MKISYIGLRHPYFSAGSLNNEKHPSKHRASSGKPDQGLPDDASSLVVKVGKTRKNNITDKYA
jgi:hypothetical protein